MEANKTFKGIAKEFGMTSRVIGKALVRYFEILQKLEKVLSDNPILIADVIFEPIEGLNFALWVFDMYEIEWEEVKNKENAVDWLMEIHGECSNLDMTPLEATAKIMSEMDEFLSEIKV